MLKITSDHRPSHVETRLTRLDDFLPLLKLHALPLCINRSRRYRHSQLSQSFLWLDLDRLLHSIVVVLLQLRLGKDVNRYFFRRKLHFLTATLIVSFIDFSSLDLSLFDISCWLMHVWRLRDADLWVAMVIWVRTDCLGLLDEVTSVFLRFQLVEVFGGDDVLAGVPLAANDVARCLCAICCASDWFDALTKFESNHAWVGTLPLRVKIGPCVLLIRCWHRQSLFINARWCQILLDPDALCLLSEMLSILLMLACVWHIPWHDQGWIW